MWKSMFKISLHLNLTNFYIITILFYHVLCCAKSLQLCLTLCDPMDGSPPSSSVHGILQAALAAAAAAKSLQLCLTLCDPRDGSPSGFPVPGILQARTLEWVAVSFSHGSNPNAETAANRVATVKMAVQPTGLRACVYMGVKEMEPRKSFLIVQTNWGLYIRHLKKSVVFHGHYFY